MKRMTVLLLEYVLLLIAIQGFRRTTETEPPGTYGTHQFELFIPPPQEAENFAQTAADSKWAFERANRLATEITEQDKRLKDVLMARHYYIRLRPYFPAPGVTLPEGRNMTFDGVTTFIFSVKKATATFTLYSFNLEYQSITLMDDNGLPLNIQSHTIDTRLSHLIITPSDAPVVGKTYLLQFKYTGKINPYTDGGMYYTYYNDIKNTTHWMVSTHMENGFQARSVFPCLDEPSYKAVFHMTLIHPTQLIALSNAMERAPEDFEPGWSITRFPPTPKMSSYLVALAIGPFVHTQRINQAGTLVRIWGWTGQDKYLEFAAEVSAKCLYSLGVYLNFPYPMSKSDQIGLPEFRAGAMENFGLIIYKYQYIAFNPDVHSTYVKQYAAQVMCHELAHQWFGDIVTASWWSELVVNEGFAAYWQYYNQAMALPEQAPFLDSEFLIAATEKALNYDANLLRSHPIVVVPTGRYFDPITYEKGSSMYRMARLTLGDQAFQEALQDYIRTYQFSNADHEMLFAKFTTAAQRHAKKDWCGRPLNVTKFLDPWFLQECFPLLTVTNNQPTSPAHVTQQPFNNISSLPISKFSYNYSWPIPLVSENYKNATPHFSWIKPAWDESCPSDQKAMKVAGKAERSIANHWDYENANRSAFARVEYDDIGYARLVMDLKANRDTHYKMSDKIALIGDQIAFLHRKMRTNQQFSYRRLIELITILVPDYPYSGLFELIQPVIEELEPMFEDGLDYGLFQRFIDKLVLANYNKLRWTVTGDWNNDVARYLMLPYAVRFDVGDSMAEAVKLFTGFQSDCAQTTTGVDKCSKVHPDLRKAVYCAGIKHGTASDFQFMMKMYQQQVVHGFYFYQEYYAMLFGMSCTQSAEDMNSLIATMFDTYRPFTYYNPFAFLSKNPAASDIMLKYIKNNADKVLHSPHLSQYLSAMIATWRTDNRLSQYEALVSELTPKADEAQKEILNEYRTNLKVQVDWHTRHYRDIIHIFYDFFVKKGDEPFSERLPKDIMPLTYDAFIQPYFPSSAHYDWTKNMTFDSTINVTMRVITATDKVNISVHRLLIQPTDIHLADMTGATLEYSKVIKDYDNGVMTIYLRNQLPVDSVFYLFIKSVGYIFYGASEGAYTNFGIFEFNGKMAWIFSTDDESGPDIRSVWPCFDEPYFKANWTVTIKHASDMIALCNMINTGLVIDKDSFGWATTSFTPTPPIASYLVAMAIGHFASMEMISKHGVLVRVWAWTGMEQYAQEGLEMAAGTADFMTEMLEIPYALPKMDLVALPQYIQTSKALENWGVICMIYDSVLVDRQYATAHDYSEVARVTPHEVVHQWFGNLVTSEWWSLIFLNEAFAQYYYSSGANYTYPQQEKYARFVRFWLADYALTHDGNPAITRPIITDRKPIFTYAPYYKGASVLYMLNNAITVPIMQEGLREYFRRNAWKTTTETMLWSAITDTTKAHNIKGWNNELLNVQALMDPWTKQENFPILKLTTNAGQVTYSQEPFIKNISILEPSPYHYKWPIPVHSQTDEEHDSLHYFVPDEEWSRPLGSSWQVDNPGSVGCYRVWYDESTWAPIRDQLSRDATVFDELTRAQFIGDAFALRERGSLPWSRVLEMVEFMADEIEYPPHFAFQRVRDQLLNAFKGTADMPNIKKFVAKSVRKAYQERGWQKSSSWTDASVATLATEHACLTDNVECLNKAKSLFDAFITNCEYSMTGTGLCNSDVAPDVRRTQYCYGLAQTPNGIDVVEKLYKWFVKNSYYFRRDDDNLLHALACLQDEATKKRLIADVLDGHYPVVLLEYIAQRDSTDTLLWDYLVANSDAVFYGVPSLSYYMDVAVGSWNTEQQLDKIDAFLNSLGTTISPENAKVIMDHKAKVQQNIDWLKANRDEIMNWINANIQ